MIPGLSLYRALGGGLQLARQSDQADPGTVAATFGHTFQGCLVVSALVLGLLIGVRAVLGLGRDFESSGSSDRRGDSYQYLDESLTHENSTDEPVE
jgi:hypothetical protein